jgi:hypothetical protein
MCIEESDFRPTPEDERRIQIAQDVFQRMAAFTSPYITVVTRTIAENQGEFVGSGSFMVFAGIPLLVTAAHVAVDAQAGSSHGPAFSNGDNTRYQFVTERFLTDSRLDVAVAPVLLDQPPATTRQACPSSLIASCAGPLDDLLFVHGFPGERSRFSTMGPGIFSSSLPYGSTTGTPAWPNFDPQMHFAMAFDPQDAEHSDRTPATLPIPTGMSGSAVWNTRRREVGEVWQPSDARVIGVLHRWDQTARCLIGTRIEHIHGLIAAQFVPSRSNTPT